MRGLRLRGRSRLAALPTLLAVTAVFGFVTVPAVAGPRPGRVGTAASTFTSAQARPPREAASQFRPSSSLLAKLRAWPDAKRGAAPTRAITLSSATNTSSARGAYTPLAPTRILDTRTDPPALGPGDTRQLVVTGGSVPTTASAVALNVTVTGTTQASYLSLYPTGQTQPAVSNLNWVAGETVPNLVIVPVGAGGAITIYNAAGVTEVVVDLQGYFSPEPAGVTAGSYVPLPPVRIADTRPSSGQPYAGQTLRAGSSLDIQAAGAGDVPAAGVSAVLLNVTVTDTTTSSYLAVFPQGGTQPSSSNLNWVAGETVANRVVVPVGPSGQVTVYNDAGSADVVVDVNGYFTQGTALPNNASLFSPVAPFRLLDTRQTPGTGLTAGGTLSLLATGVGGIPAGATAAVTNVTATGTTAASFFTVYPGGSRPGSSDVNWAAGQTVPNLTVATLSSSGTTTIYNDAGTAQVVVDAFGYFTPDSTTASPLSITTTTLPGGTVGTFLSTALAATGGVAPYSWALRSGSLPPGVCLGSTGEISGTPTAAGTYSFEVGVTDASSPTPEVATAQLSLSISLAATQLVASQNWSGYVLQSGPYTQVSGTFTVPSLYQGQTNTYLSEWVGVDGFNNSDLIQAGIQEYPVPGSTTRFYLFPWWEILPATETPITTMTVNPADQVTITISQLSGSTWTITLDDSTDGQSFTTNQTYTGPGASAEWIVEAPEVGVSISTLADYTTTTFSGLGATGPQMGYTEVVMVQNSVQVSTPSNLVPAGFSVAYGKYPPAPP
ncbi:MAG: G1 family glutamic endopeptidase [Candidatus Dormibacteria bacterium]